MKSFGKIAVMYITFLFFLTSCSNGDGGIDPTPTPDPDPEITENVLDNGGTLQGALTLDTRLPKNGTYYLKGGVHVKEGVTLFIEEGVTVKSDPNETTTSYLAVEQGAKINAVGTAISPIVFTSGKDTPAVQDWGGIIILGKARINNNGGTAESETLNDIYYGGDDDTDNSGVIQYVRVEYSGRKINDAIKYNGFSFEGVGSGTTVDHIAVYRTYDDGIQFYGGTVSIKYAVVYATGDDLFDISNGWRGKGQFWVGIQNEIGSEVDSGLEFDNNEYSSTLTPFTEPMLSNMTLKGFDNGQTVIMTMRKGTKGQMLNIVAYGFTSGGELEDGQTFTNMNDGSLYVKSSVFDKGWTYIDYNGTDKPFESEGYNNTIVSDVPDFISNSYVGTTAEKAMDISTLDSWFDTASYIGAVPADNNWVTSGVWAKVE